MAPEDPNPGALSLADPLREVTRKERRMLLGLSLLGLAVAFTGLTPQSIPAFGITFEPSDREALRQLFAGMLTFFLAAFLLYGWTDFLTWRMNYHKERQDAAAHRERYNQQVQEGGIEKDQLVKRSPGYNRMMKTVPFTSFVRACFEFLLPVIVAIVSIWVVWP